MGGTASQPNGLVGIRLAGVLAANMPEDWLAAEDPTNPPLAEACHELQDCGTPSAETGLRLCPPVGHCQVQLHQESTGRQYALREKAQELVGRRR